MNDYQKNLIDSLVEQNHQSEAVLAEKNKMIEFFVEANIKQKGIIEYLEEKIKDYLDDEEFKEYLEDEEFNDSQD